MKRWSLPLSGVAAHTTVAKAAQNIVENSSSLPMFSECSFLKISGCLFASLLRGKHYLLDAVVGTGSEDIILLYKSQSDMGDW